MYKQAVRTGLVALGVLVAGAVIAQPGPGYGRGGPGYGPGMMGMLQLLKLSPLNDEQRDKLLAIQEENRRKNWDKMGEMRSEQFKLRRMYNADNVDSQAFAEQQKKVDDLRREILVSRLESRKQMEAVLTPEQREQFRQYGPRWMDSPDVE
jgi:Spy/CpxP family protein refolding chaperone